MFEQYIIIMYIRSRGTSIMKTIWTAKLLSTQMKNIYKVLLSQSFAVYFLHEKSKDGILEHSRIS